MPPVPPVPLVTPLRRPARLVAAVLCVGVAAVHVGDQGGVTALADPDWIGWGYRLLEVAALVVAVGLVVVSSSAWAGAAGAAGVRERGLWLLGLLVAAGPLLGYVLSRTTGLPGDSDDVGNWGEPLGVVSLVVEGLLAGLAVVALLRPASAPVAEAEDGASPSSASSPGVAATRPA